MEVLRKCAKAFGTVVPKAKVRSITYVPSIFNYLTNKITAPEENILVNTLSRCIVRLDAEDKCLLRQASIQVSEADCSDTVRQMIEQRILVPAWEDETKLYLELYDILKILDGKKGKSGYKIFTTTACNARCFYCFEEGFVAKTMNEETTDALFEYIMKTKHSGQIMLYWFGGEPLCNPRVMTQLCTKLKVANVSFVSRLITNGFLFTQEMVDEAVDLWNLKRCQITLDGMHEEYKRRKNYKADPENPLETVLDNIEMVAEANIQLDIRLNFDQNNIDSILEVAAYLKKRFGHFKNIYIYPSPLKDEWYDYSNPTSEEDKQKLPEVSAQIKEIVQTSGVDLTSGFSENIPLYFCMANNTRSAVIAPDGKLYSCQYFSDELSYGDVWNGITNRELYDKWTQGGQLMEQCKNCAMLPQCTAFSMCPVRPKDCYEKQCKRAENQIKKSCLDMSKKAN